jgi:hypothetical protein
MVTRAGYIPGVTQNLLMCRIHNRSTTTLNTAIIHILTIPYHTILTTPTTLIIPLIMDIWAMATFIREPIISIIITFALIPPQGSVHNHSVVSIQLAPATALPHLPTNHPKIRGAFRNKVVPFRPITCSK